VKKCLAVGIIILLVGTCIIPAIALDTEKPLPASRASWLYVGGSGPGNYTKIQDAINVSSDGGTVFVYNDSSPYNESVRIIYSIKLLGENQTSTIINSKEDYIIKILTDNVTVEGFTLSGSAYGIFIEANSCVITNNIIKSGGIHFFFTYNNTISHNTILGNRGIGIYLTETAITVIENNSISGNFTGISAYKSSNTLIANNHLNNNTQGIMLIECSPANVTSNVIANATRFAIFLQGPMGTNHIIGNMVMSCYLGIFFWLSENQILEYNTILNSGLGIKLVESNRNLITHNVFRENTLNAVFNESYQNKWRRNFWDHPRILPYIISGTTIIYRWPLKWFNFDWRPAQEPYDTFLS